MKIKTKHKRFCLWEFLLSLVGATALFCWLGWGIKEGELRLPNPRPSVKLDPVSMHSNPVEFLLWAVLIGGLGLYCLYPAFREICKLVKPSNSMNNDRDIYSEK